MSVQLYTHSDYSLLESVLTVEELVKQAASLGYEALALTDHNSTAGHWELERCCREAGLKPIFGLDVDVDFGEPGTTAQVVVLALDQVGYRNLLRFASQQIPVPSVMLPEFKTGLAILEGGSTGQLTKLVSTGRIREAQALHTWYTEEFGSAYFLRWEREQDGQLRDVLPGSSFVLCQDVRCADPASIETLEILAKIKGGVPSIPPYPMLSWQDLVERLAVPKEVIASTLELAERCQVQLPRDSMLPAHPGGESLTDLAWRGAKLRYGELTAQVKERLEYELDIIEKLGFSDYFLIVADLVQFARGAGIPVGPGRGSAAGSLVAYVLGITEVDPLAWGLVFERFLNPERRSKPDIDVDFCYERRTEVLNYAAERFGRDHVAQIGTYGIFGPKAAAQEVERSLGEKNPRAAAEIQPLKRHRATHAAGIIVTKGPVQDVTAVYTDRDLPVTHYDMYALEDLGAWKIDILGLRTLTLLRRMEEEVQKREREFSLKNIPLDDHRTLELLGQGRTLGIFQLESALFQDLLRQLQPKSFADIAALLALGRPGPLSMFREFAARRENPSRITYLHPELREILGETYGLILYQEQVMTIAHRLGGLSLGEADLLRRALGKDDAQAIKQWQDCFLKGAQERGLSAADARKLFGSIVQFSGYAFNKAHSVSYALLSWRAAFLKAHYPEVFFTVLLNQGSAGKGQNELLAEAQALKVQVLRPSVLYSEAQAALEGKALRLGLTASRQLPPYTAQQIVEKRQRHRWTSFAQFRAGLKLEPKQLETLILMGAADDFGDRNQHLKALGLSTKQHLELLRLEKELLGGYVSSHPCSPFLPLVGQLKGELEAAVGEVVELKAGGRTCQGELDTPQGQLSFHGQLEALHGVQSGGRVALFGSFKAGELEAQWGLPLGPILLITPQPEQLETIKGILGAQKGMLPTILLFGEAYHLLPQEFWVQAAAVDGSLAEVGIVYTWFDPWKEHG